MSAICWSIVSISHCFVAKSALCACNSGVFTNSLYLASKLGACGGAGGVVVFAALSVVIQDTSVFALS